MTLKWWSRILNDDDIRTRSTSAAVVKSAGAISSFFNRVLLAQGSSRDWARAEAAA
jgi:hypothetical protein